MAGDGRVREGWKRLTIDLPEQDDTTLRQEASAQGQTRAIYVRGILTAKARRLRKKAQQ